MTMAELHWIRRTFGCVATWSEWYARWRFNGKPTRVINGWYL